MSLAAGSSVWTSDQRKLTLGRLLKSGGAGSVYQLPGSAQQVAKIYHDSVERADYERKVTAMLKLSPQLPDLLDHGKRYVQIAWPQALLRDERGRFLGFLMPVVDIQSTSELECILQERQARAANLPVGLGAKITLATNLAAVLAELHRQGHHVVDLKPVNVCFYPQSLYMAMLDCDGFSIQGEGERFAAPQITPDYVAPEFQARPLTAVGEEQQDRFALAVVIFQLLNFGIHPFAGKPSSDRVPTDIPGRIAARCYAYGLRANASLAPSMASGHATMPLELRQLFDRAFESAGATRPPAMEWAAMLRGYAQRANQRLVVCAKNPEHQHFAGLPCAACTRMALIASTAQKNALAARQAASPAHVLARAIGLGPRYPGTGPAPAAGRVLSPLPAGWPGNPYTNQTWQRPPPMPTTWPRRAPPTSRLPQNVAGWVLIVVIFAFLGLIDHFKNSSRSQFQFTYPPAPVAGTAAPIPTIQPAIETSPPVESLKTIRSAALAMAQGNRFESRAMLSALRRATWNQPSVDPSLRAEYQSKFTAFARVFAQPGHAGSVDMMIELRKALKQNPYDAEAAYELGWLELVGGDRHSAETEFVRAIWADPDHSGAWYGFGATATDDEAAVGSLAIAESLFTSAQNAKSVREKFSPQVLQGAGIDAEHSASLHKRAQSLDGGFGSSR